MTAREGARRPSVLPVLETGAIWDVSDAVSRPGPRHPLAEVE